MNITVKNEDGTVEKLTLRDFWRDTKGQHPLWKRVLTALVWMTLWRKKALNIEIAPNDPMLSDGGGMA